MDQAFSLLWLSRVSVYLFVGAHARGLRHVIGVRVLEGELFDRPEKLHKGESQLSISTLNLGVFRGSH